MSVMFLSIVTVNRNNAAGLKRTIDSILPILGSDVEHIVVDGASTDDSVVVAIGRLADRPDIGQYVTLVSEPDNGIYSAMNKGSRLAIGRYIAYVNSGDELIANTYLEYIDFVRKAQPDVAYAKTHMRLPGGGSSGVYEAHPEQLSWHTIPHLTAMVLKRLFDDINGFDEGLRIVADRDLFIRLKIMEAQFVFYPDLVSIFELGGVSSGPDTKLEDLILNHRYGFISNFKYYRKVFLSCLKSKLFSR